MCKSYNISLGLQFYYFILAMKVSFGGKILEKFEDGYHRKYLYYYFLLYLFIYLFIVLPFEVKARFQLHFSLI